MKKKRREREKREGVGREEERDSKAPNVVF